MVSEIIIIIIIDHLRRSKTKPTKCPMWPAKTQSSLDINHELEAVYLVYRACLS